MIILKHRLRTPLFSATSAPMEEKYVSIVSRWPSLFALQKVTVWNDGEPNNYRYSDFQPGEQCVEIIARAAKDGSLDNVGKLNDIPCIKPTLGAICQREGNSDWFFLIRHRAINAIFRRESNE